jgi:predicted small lipoprotein YifL
MTRRLLILFLILAMAAPLAACGRKSAPAQPPGSDHPRKYPTQ